MIFAILGVLILIVSFVIALYSLVKEQNQIPDAHDDLGEPELVIDKAAKSELDTIKKPDVVLSRGYEKTSVVSDDSATLKWEPTAQQILSKEPDVVSKLDEQRQIEEIEAKLAKIKSEGSQDQRDEIELPQGQQVSTKSNLSGSFSIREMLEKPQ